MIGQNGYFLTEIGSIGERSARRFGLVAQKLILQGKRAVNRQIQCKSQGFVCRNKKKTTTNRYNYRGALRIPSF